MTPYRTGRRLRRLPRVFADEPIRGRVLIALVITAAIHMGVLIYVQVTYLPRFLPGLQGYAQVLTVSTGLLILAGAVVVWDLSRAADRANARWRDLSLTDALTGAYNRRYCNLRLREELARAHRHGHPFSLVLVDVDHFKQINDRHGHAAGDAVLRDLCKVIRSESRVETALCRYGGDELAIILPETALSGALVYADRIRTAVGRTSFRHGAAVTISVGVGAFPDDAETADDLVTAADASLYAAKEGGRNRVGGRQTG